VHIDFGHFLGNYKSKYGVKRERAPFIFNPQFAHILGGRHGARYNEFTKMCGRAYNILRKHANMFINLFMMVRDSRLIHNIVLI
jgi:phosphatidylinositol-4,5-bisphosphate 3-kinase